MAKKQPKTDIDQIRLRAKEKGLEGNFYYVTTLHRYEVQMRTLDALEQTIKDVGMTVEKSYIKDTSNLYINPAVAEYNRTATAANNTVATLIKIVSSFTGDEKVSGLSKAMSELMTNE